ncbi:MAG TPA: hypothetical protein VG820_10620 [Fimbriimonadaceae bacterium]|nr:hypothetical protein [Fimbriimonadaceae bacterium]
MGETYTYATKVTGDADGEMDMSLKAVKVDPDSVVLESRYLDAKRNGKSLPQTELGFLKSIVVTITEDRQGRPTNVEVKGAPGAVADQIKAQQSGTGVAYPNRPVKIGESWVTESTMQGKKVRLTYKLVKVGPVDGRDVAFLEATPDAGGLIKSEGPMTLSIDLATGMTIQTKFSGEVSGKKVTVQMIRS